MLIVIMVIILMIIIELIIIGKMMIRINCVIIMSLNIMIAIM